MVLDVLFSQRLRVYIELMEGRTTVEQNCISRNIC